jgi:hypothetical protein
MNREQAARTHCPAGHVYDAANTRRYRGRRYCRACSRRRVRTGQLLRRLSRLERQRTRIAVAVPPNAARCA